MHWACNVYTIVSWYDTYFKMRSLFAWCFVNICLWFSRLQAWMESTPTMSQFRETRKSSWEDPWSCVCDAKQSSERHAGAAASNLKIRTLSVPFQGKEMSLGQALGWLWDAGWALPWEMMCPASSSVIADSRSACGSPLRQGWPWGEPWINLQRCKCVVWGRPAEPSSLVHSQSLRWANPGAELEGARRRECWWVARVRTEESPKCWWVAGVRTEESLRSPQETSQSNAGAKGQRPQKARTGGCIDAHRRMQWASSSLWLHCHRAGLWYVSKGRCL